MTTNTPAAPLAAPAKSHPTKLTDAYLKSVKRGPKPQKISIEKGLYLLVSVAGSKTWYQAYTFGDKQKTLRLGDFPFIGKEEAQDMARDARRLLEQGIDPVAQRELDRLRNQQKHEATFGAIAREWLDERKKRVAPYTYDQSEKWITGYVINQPVGICPISEVTTAMLFQHVKGIATGAIRHGTERTAGSPIIASRTLQLINQIFRFAIGSGRCVNNPAVSVDMQQMSLPKRKTRHNRTLTVPQVRELLERINLADMRLISRAALRLMLLTAARTQEVVGARWSEIDLDAALWAIPGSRMKNGFDHTIPLATQTVAMLREVKRMTGYSAFVFPAQGEVDRPMARGTFNEVFKRLNMDGVDWFRAHGSRSTMNVWALESGRYRSEVIEKALSHVERNKVKAAYSGAAKYLDERRILAQDWADALLEPIAALQADTPSVAVSEAVV